MRNDLLRRIVDGLATGEVTDGGIAVPPAVVISSITALASSMLMSATATSPA